mmetsp:Transcript_44416/g.96544  ORF Transcript_44416/g.96544 Transcript_44416/m.96544 type:complete len:238 (-) Transcript_44416:129-842(-)|eukprot:CAMPEP_0170614122 /NCGR_PEP_ID=MMETSP0224-20130122/24631_1 /TAXON_ID=285029 /ORGANISM="Togula jolla, Strain CCCM 725" /LENGTH=237 /DNA_ID=CAMNT_0010939757 /DNA_START=50 /DNA_END=763 /DNA_ORIENTATION=+
MARDASEDAEETDPRSEELEAVVKVQRERIAELEDELQELRAITSAQENVLTDQRRIIETQSGLIDDLNEHMQRQLSEQRRVEDGEAAARQDAEGALVHEAQPRLRIPGGGVQEPQPRQGVPGGLGRQGPGCGQRSVGGDAATARPTRGAAFPKSHTREQLLAQTRFSQQQSPRCEANRPRPAPRARSAHVVERLNSGVLHSARGPGLTHAPSGGCSVGRKSGCVLPPALPLLRQEA